MVVIPARNEAAVIERAVSSFPKDTVIVVDDHSKDGTADVARATGAEVLAAPPLPRGGMGKSNACSAGARGLNSRWVLFTDADAWFEPSFLPAALGYAEAENLFLLSVYLEPDYETLKERALVHYARALFFCGVSTRGYPKELFTGQCLLVRRDAYLFMGGHGATIAHLFEEMQLASFAKRHQLKAAVARAGDLGHSRMYAGWRGLRRGVARRRSDSRC